MDVFPYAYKNYSDRHQDWIMEQWEKNYYISSIAGAANGSSLVVMSKGWLTEMPPSHPVHIIPHNCWKHISYNVEFIIFVSMVLVFYFFFPWWKQTLGTPYTQQSYKVSESFPFKWINKKWKEGFHVTSMTTAGNRWGVVMSRNSGFSEQVWLNYLIVKIFAEFLALSNGFIKIGRL